MSDNFKVILFATLFIYVIPLIIYILRNMGLFNNIPTAKKAQKVRDKVLGLSHELKCIIVSHGCVDFRKIDLGGLEYALFMYDLEFYRQVMQLNHSNFYIENILRTIFISMETGMQKAGNNISSGYFFNVFIKLSKTINQLPRIAEADGIDAFLSVALYLCSDECGMTTQEIAENEKMVIEIANHFEKIIRFTTT